MTRRYYGFAFAAGLNVTTDHHCAYGGGAGPMAPGPYTAGRLYSWLTAEARDAWVAAGGRRQGDIRRADVPYGWTETDAQEVSR
jgi:hypothetical protein